jgi:hypothetical protein
MVSNHLSPKDAYRKALQRTPLIKGSKAAILVDVYWITPDSITSLMADLGLEAVIWVGKSHLATFGCNYGETVWYRINQNDNLAVMPEPDDYIISRASGSEPRNEPHPSCDWLFRENYATSGSKFLTWAVVETPAEGIWHTVFFSRNDSPPVCPSTMPYVDLMEIIDIPRSLFDKSTLGPVKRAFDRLLNRKRPTLVYKPLYTYLSLYNFLKNRNAYTFASISAAAREWAKDDKAFGVLMAEFTDLAQNLLLNTVHAAFWKNLPREEAYLTGITEEMAETVERYHVSRKRLDKPMVDPTATQPSSLKRNAGWLLAGALAAYFGIQAWKVWRWLRTQNIQAGSYGSFMSRYIKRKVEQLKRKDTVLSSLTPTLAKIIELIRKFSLRTDYWAICVIAPVAEEMIKAKGWGHTLALMLTEALIVHSQAGIKAYIPTAMMHLAAKGLSSAGFNKTAIMLHSAWNHFAYLMANGNTLANLQPGSLVYHTNKSKKDVLTESKDLTVHSQWVESYYNAPWESRPRIETDAKGIFTILNPALPRQVKSYTDTVFTPCPEVRMQYYATADKANRDPGFYAGYLIGNFPLYAPARSNDNLMTALKYRLLQAAPGDPDRIEAAWLQVPDLKFIKTYSEIQRDEVWQQYWDHLESAARRARAQRGQDTVVASHYTPRDKCFNRTSYFVKTNEKLPRQEKGFPALKVRGIILLQPEAVDSIGPALFEVARRLKSEHSMRNPPVYNFANGKRRVRISYASSATADDLTRWLAQAKAWVRRGHEQRFWVLVAGDDGFMLTMDGDGYLYIETDFSQYDQSEGRQALRYQRRQQRRLGLSRKDAQCEKRIGNATITCALGKLIMMNRYWRATGESATTHGNCIVHEGAILYVFKTGGVEGMEARYLDLGLKVKMRMSRDLATVSFLKGWWLPGPAAQEIWTILPSRVLKIGQHLGNPCHIRGYSANMYLACRQHAVAVAKTYAAFPWSPIVGDYVTRWKDLHPDVKAWRLEPWKVQSKVCHPVDHEAAVQAAARRYGVAVEEVEELGEIYRKADVMTFIKHPLFFRMAVTDY